MARLRHRGVGDVPVAGVNRRGHAGVDGTAIAPHSAGQEPHEALHVPSDGHVGLQLASSALTFAESLLYLATDCARHAAAVVQAP
eukprot:CAMPEP_0204536264 /NCGR_PEP_ID=MMETSP0661-20131031/14339_1 /ASSEMBLY_ACC=CAM_ASM_000606 /TAXON_ID=109239 /ORGANISM="Alexandrium margalefi, Strain AMGDE01CS-322" /LENGTH=84 /DNA_ID=CAMNT_0051542783 /DNA_START=60 /DNA_END=311 /DNA_ORIENTATION=+